MKKLRYLLVLFIAFILTGCKSNKVASNVFDDFCEKINSSTSYYMKGNLNIHKKDYESKFTVEVSASNDEFYRVSYQNLNSLDKQIIVKNNSGVYILEPKLNKEFKFESSWPSNSSHIYVLKSVIKDILEDDTHEVLKTDDGILIKSKISHKFNKKLDMQEVLLSKDDYSLKKVSYFEGDTLKMELLVDSIEFNKTFNSDHFNHEKIMSEASLEYGEGSLTSLVFKEVGYQIEGVTLASENKTEDEIILCYEGEASYVISINSSKNQDVRVYDDFLMLNDRLCYLSKNSLTYLVSNIMVKITYNNLDYDTLEEIIASLTFENQV